jgi:hypothetical protein
MCADGIFIRFVRSPRRASCLISGITYFDVRSSTAIDGSCSPAFGSGGRDGRMPRERIANQSNWQRSRRQAVNDGASQFPFPHVVEATGSGSARIWCAHHCHEKNLVSFNFASSIILCASNSVSQFQTLLLSVASENSPGNSDDGNKTKTVAYRDLKIRRIPSKIMLRLTYTAAGVCW